ncbi:MAG: cytochrome C [Anaerolineae bacterium]|nr:cytochrome C [Anaerolineae bacterium]
MRQPKTLSELDRSENTSQRLLHWIPSALLLIAAALLVVSIAFPYWGLVLEAPQYPGGLQMRVFVNYMTGDEDPALDEVREIDGLNHYIGMKSLYEAAAFERSIALPGVIGMIVALGIVAFLRRRWVWVLALPAIVFPFVFLGDLAYWMNNYGQNLDPYAPLSSAIQPFTPPILGEGVIGQFRTVAYVDAGWYLATGAAVLVAAALLIWLGSRIAASRK